MTTPDHFRALERMYLAAPINKIFQPRISISLESATIEIDISEKFFHAANAVHGSVYFKMLDDAAFFAANSIETNVFVLTTAFTTYLTKPISNGQMKSIGKIVNKNNTQIIAESVVYNSNGTEIGRGNGIFVFSKILLRSALGYSE
ncbi:MAG: PaaI family thioesterase [Planctomycetota bacterium]